MPDIRSNIIDCYVFRRRGDVVEFLMLLRTPESRIGGTWQAVHGKIEAGEKAWKAALREMKEETGLTPLRFWQLESVNTFYLADRDRILMCPAFAAEVAPDAEVVLCHEHTAQRWVTAEEVGKQFMWPGQRRAVREVLDLIIAGSPAEPFLRIDLTGHA